MLRIAVIGAGHQGGNHLQFLKHFEDVTLALVVDRKPERASAHGVASATSILEHLSVFDAAVVAVPTSDHFAVASALIQSGKHVLIEKPVTASVAEAEALQELAKKAGVIAAVGFPERYNPAVEEAAPFITRPLFVETHRLGIFSPRSLDVDVVFDLMIHDLDLLTMFLKEEPAEIEAVGIPILSQNIDIANARLKFPGKCVANLTASRVSAQKMRKMRLFQPYSYLSLDFLQQSLSVFSLEQNTAPSAEFPEIQRKEFPPQKKHPLQLELQAFFDAVRGGKSTIVGIPEAIASLRMALAIKSKFAPIEL